MRREIALVLLLLVGGCSGHQPQPQPQPSAPTGTAVDPLSFLAQYRCPDGSAPTACASPVRQLSTDPVFYSKRDWPGPWDGVFGDSVLLPGGQSLDPFYVGAYGHAFTPPNDGGDLYGVVGSNAVVLKTRDGSLKQDLYFVGADCGGTGWLLFPSTVPTGSWYGYVARIGQSTDRSCAPNQALSDAYTQVRLEAVDVPVMSGGAVSRVHTQTIVSEHYDGPSAADAAMLERFYFAQGNFGRYRWERWDHNGTPARDLSADCPAMPPWDSAPPFPGAVMTNCRMWTNLTPEPGTWAYSSYGWAWP